ncbi:hypothetical protein [Actinomycetospora cinnamomea]|uniref:hypothetical protein n=1 Tax=Actinomycetospora cinnamomea TaxID=663609 RepID=UPI001401C3B4|nr:hypothetical protein [Actinomycetospora cinnamomea]
MGRGLAALLLTLGVVVLGAPPALAADPVPGPAPYGGQLDVPDAEGVFDGEHALEVAMLALGSVNGIAFAGVVIASRFRGSTASAIRRALMARTARGVPSGLRRRGTGNR